MLTLKTSTIDYFDYLLIICIVDCHLIFEIIADGKYQNKQGNDNVGIAFPYKISPDNKTSILNILLTLDTTILTFFNSSNSFFLLNSILLALNKSCNRCYIQL